MARCVTELIHRLWPMVWLYGQGLGRARIGKLMTGSLGKWYVERLLLIGKKCGNKFVSHVNARQRLTSAGEDFSDPICGYQSSSFPSWSCQSGYGGRIKVMGGLNIMDFHSSRPSWS